MGSCRSSDIIQGFNVTLKAPKVSVFSPTLGKSLIEKYLSDCETIVDPFSGFSGRMIGVSNCGKTYVGFDINEDHVKESNEIISYKKFKNCTVSVRDVLSDYDKESYDALFTCPPYFDKEIWGSESEFHTCDEWVEVCLRKFNCGVYLFVVDFTDKYKDNIAEELITKSHFGMRKELVLKINAV